MTKPDWEELVLQSMAAILFYKREKFRFNRYQCINLCYALVSKLSTHCTIKRPIESPTISIQLKRRRDTSSSLSGGKEVIQGAGNLSSRGEVIRGAWKEVYRAVKEAELYLENCSSHRWWIKSATLAFTGEAHAVHIHDLVWSLLSLDLNILFAQGTWYDSYSAHASRKIGDFVSEMSNLTRIYDEHADKKHLISTFHQLLRNYQEEEQTFQKLQQNCQPEEQTNETADKDLDKNKIGVAKFISAKLEAGFRLDPAITDSPVPAWLQIDPEDLITNQRPIGQGSYGAVYEGSWLGLEVAVKELSVDAYDLFQMEAAVLGKLHSPFIVQLIGTCIKNESCYLVMELVPSNLETYIEKRCAKVSGRPFPLHVAVDIMLQISRGMEYLHSRNVMHMDLKSSNVLIRPSAIPAFRNEGYCRVKLCDFGMAGLKLYSLRSSFPKGTCYWRAPEAFAFQSEELVRDNKTPKEYTYKADVYSFAMTSYEILTGKQPFEGVSARDLYGKVIQGVRPDLPSSCPLPVADYIKKCWHTDPSRRPCFQDVSNFLRYTKLLITRMKKDQDLVVWDSLSLKFDRRELSKCDDERFDGRVTTAEEKLIVRALEGEFTPQESYNPSPGEQATQCSSIGTTGIVLANIPQYMQKFSYQEIQKCTDNFTREVSGVLCCMWKGILGNGRHVMVKAVNEVRHFYNELDILCQIHHPNIIRLRGISANNGCYLVYDHMVMGPLSKQLFGRSRTTCLLNWPIRRNIMLARARSLAYIHVDCPRKLLNVSLNSNNIFLDERFTPKLSVFGKSIATDVNNISFSGRSEEFKIDSEFGFIVLELLTGQRREDILHRGNSISESLAGLRSHAFMDFIDHRMNKEIEEEEARRLINLALCCLLNDPFGRPSLSNVVLIIEGHSELPTLPSLDTIVNAMPFYEN